MEVCQKHVYQVELNKAETSTDLGLKIEAELAEDCDKEDDLRVYVADVRSGSLADRKGKTKCCFLLIKISSIWIDLKRYEYGLIIQAKLGIIIHSAYFTVHALPVVYNESVKRCRIAGRLSIVDANKSPNDHLQEEDQ